MPPGDNYRVHRNIGWRTGPTGWPEWFDAAMNNWRPWDPNDSGPFPPAEMVSAEHRHAVDASVLSVSAILLLHPEDLVEVSTSRWGGTVPCGDTRYGVKDLATKLMAIAFWHLGEEGMLMFEPRPRRVFSGFDLYLRSTGPSQQPGIVGALAALVPPTEPALLKVVVRKWFGKTWDNPHRVVVDAVNAELAGWEDWLHTPMCVAAQDQAVLSRYRDLHRGWTAFVSGQPEPARALINSTARAISSMEKDRDRDSSIGDSSTSSW